MRTLEHIENAMAALEKARKNELGKKAGEAASVVPAQAERFYLPRERYDDLTGYYGEASRRGNRLEWFNFPVADMRLYTREGAGLSDHTGDQFDDHRCHELISGRLETAYRDLLSVLGDRFYSEGWHIFSGCFNYRVKRGGANLSTHSWGIAIDINSEENRFRSREHSLSDMGIDIMEAHGFLSGGRAWGHDYMHFQAAIPHVSRGSFYEKNGFPRSIKTD